MTKEQQKGKALDEGLPFLTLLASYLMIFTRSSSIHSIAAVL